MTRAHGVAAALMLLAVPGAGRAAVANDARATPDALAVPTSLAASLADATPDGTDPSAGCGVAAGGPSLWYQPTAGLRGRVGLELHAVGGSGTAVAVYRRDEEGDLSRVVCDATDRRGDAGLFFTAADDERYLVMVAAGVRAEAGRFSLQTFRPEPPATLPGAPLPAAGVRAAVDVLRDTDDAWSTVMRPGVTYRIAVAAAVPCGVGIGLYAPGVHDPDGDPVARRACGGYLTYTPAAGQGGRYGLLVDANPGARRVGYRLRVAPAGVDDLAPGLPLPERTARTAAVSSRGVDQVDVWGFTVTRRSRVRLRLATAGAVDLRLYSAAGRLLQCACGEEGALELERAALPGRYVAVVSAPAGGGGRYRLLRTSRVITTARTLVNGARTTVTTAGRSVAVAVQVSPAPVGGTATVDLDAFDPVAGWLFRRRFTLPVIGGAARIAWTPPTAGRWRLRGDYSGTPTDSPAPAGTALVVAG